jgi:hypothetical protein
VGSAIEMGCEDGHECRLLNIKSRKKIGHGEGLLIYEYKYTKKDTSHGHFESGHFESGHFESGRVES